MNQNRFQYLVNSYTQAVPYFKNDVIVPIQVLYWYRCITQHDKNGTVKPRENGRSCFQRILSLH